MRLQEGGAQVERVVRLGQRLREEDPTAVVADVHQVVRRLQLVHFSLRPAILVGHRVYSEADRRPVLRCALRAHQLRSASLVVAVRAGAHHQAADEVAVVRPGDSYGGLTGVKDRHAALARRGTEIRPEGRRAHHPKALHGHLPPRVVVHRGPPNGGLRGSQGARALERLPSHRQPAPFLVRIRRQEQREHFLAVGLEQNFQRAFRIARRLLLPVQAKHPRHPI
mmetsp:Transcript_6699/g.25890  ORF Transcript_6699/g.25890 Transcript_6699/m.25890 type:complete len:224 (+) Transcript_6699:748-1419(+)